MATKESLERARVYYDYRKDAECIASTARNKIERLATEFDAVKLKEAKWWREASADSDWPEADRRIADLERP